MSARRVATKSSVAKVASSSVAMPKSCCTTRIAIDAHQPTNSGPKYLTFRLQRPGPGVGDHVGRFGQIRGQEEDDEELDQFDRLVLHGSDANPETRAVHFFSECEQQHEEHERRDDPEVLIRGEAAKMP